MGGRACMTHRGTKRNETKCKLAKDALHILHTSYFLYYYYETSTGLLIERQVAFQILTMTKSYCRLIPLLLGLPCYAGSYDPYGSPAFPVRYGANCPDEFVYRSYDLALLPESKESKYK
jgi:hypothetical protein